MRKKVPDIMKGIAVVMMVQVHLAELLARQGFLASPAGKISLFLGGPFAAPVLMAVMGYFLAGSSLTIKGKILRGLKLIGLGLLLNIGLNAHLLIRYSLGISDIDPWQYIFGADILFLAGFSIILLTIIKLLAGRKWIVYLILALLVSAMTPILSRVNVNSKPAEYAFAFLWGNYSWSYFPLFPWLAYPLAGYSLKLIEEQFHLRLLSGKKNVWVIIALLGTGLVLTYAYAFRISTDLTAYYHHGLVFFTWTIGFLSFWTLLIRELVNLSGGNTLFNYSQWLGKNVTAAYVIQWLIIGNIATALYRTQPFIGLLLWFVLIMTITSLFIKIWQMIKR
jgi:uncharacterized membrane protein